VFLIHHDHITENRTFLFTLLACDLVKDKSNSSIQASLLLESIQFKIDYASLRSLRIPEKEKSEKKMPRGVTHRRKVDFLVSLNEM
jgi:hypothetical protein